MTKREFDMLLYLNEHDILDLSEAARLLFVSEEEVTAAYNCLLMNGEVSEQGITAKGKTYLNEHKIDNAIILVCQRALFL